MTKTNASILIIDDDDDILIAGNFLLRRFFTTVDTCNQPDLIPQKLANHKYDCIVLDMNFGPGESSGEQGLFWLKEIVKLEPNAVIIMITAHGGLNIAIDAMKFGATDFIVKPWHNEKLVTTVTTAVKLSQSQTKSENLRQTNQLLANTTNTQTLLGKSNAMQNVHSLIMRAAPTDANVLILGENGTGKELIAREIHKQSLRAQHIFMSVDVGALSESLFESELFGYTKGAFSGANENRIGRLLAANGGTLFLDEIGNIPLHLQAKLLTILEQRKVTALGDNIAKPFDVRVIAATNLSHSEIHDPQLFRQDLLFRLNTVEITSPPLRQRSEDIEEIANFYIGQFSRKYNHKPKKLASDALNSLKQYSWPGNVRALKHAVERAVILSEQEVINVSDFQLNSPPPTAESSAVLNRYSPNNTVAPKESQSINPTLNLAEVEKNTIVQALKQYRYNISHTAKALGLTRAALYRRMEKHDL